MNLGKLNDKRADMSILKLIRTETFHKIRSKFKRTANEWIVSPHFGKLNCEGFAIL